MPSFHERVSRESTIHIIAPPGTAFPLFTPRGEKLWVQGWSPVFIYPLDGETRERMIFTTPSKFADEDAYQWVLMKYDPVNYEVHYVVNGRSRVWYIDVACRPVEGGTNATVRYTYFSSTSEGHARNRVAIDAMFRENLHDWEEALNRYVQSCIQN